MITKVIAIAAIKADAYCTSKFVDGVEVVTYEDGVTPIDESLVNAKVAELQAIEDYQSKRRNSYNAIVDQLDMLYKDIVAGKLDTTGTWATHIKAVKDANPKPS